MEYYGTSYWAPTNSLVHYGIKGMRWGVRRYQNADGSLTAAGRKRYYGSADKIQKDIDSFKGYEKGIYDKKGRTLLSETDVRNSVKGLEIARDKAKQKGDAKRNKDYQKINRRKQIIDKAAKKARSEANYQSNMKKYYSDSLKSTINKYSGKDGWKNWLTDQYGNDWKDADYMKKVFEIDDVKQHALDELENEIFNSKLESKNMTRFYSEGEKFWNEKAKLYETSSIYEISNKNYRLAKKYAKQFDRDNKV